MLRLTEIKLPLDHSEDDINAAILKRLGIAADELIGYMLFRRGFDARKPSAILFIYTLDVEVKNEPVLFKCLKDTPHIAIAPDTRYHFVTQAPNGHGKYATPDDETRHARFPLPIPLPESEGDKVSLRESHDNNLAERPVVIGTGPCGIFAGLILAQMGFRPIILERGKAVRERTKDTFGLWRQGKLDPESNVQFGEGGAGTFSDGKLHSQIKDPKHYGRKVLAEFVKAGAPPEILYVSKPHIGTFRLVGMVEEMRHTIESLGGEFRFQSRVTDIEISDGSDNNSEPLKIPVSSFPRRRESSDLVELGSRLRENDDCFDMTNRQVRGVVLANGERIASNHVVLAVGHSARDTFEMLHRRGVYMEAKPFSIGLRIEHPQSLIDRARFGKNAGNPLLGAADYKLVHHCKNGRSVYSFCMCPGGTVVAATSEEGSVVTNGMSQYSRNERNANSGIVVGITPEDYPGDALAGIAFQRRWEARAFELGGKNYCAPGQLVGDFLAGRPSTAFGSVIPSYTPGVHLCDLSTALPDYAVAAIREALSAFDKQIKGFAMDDAVLTGVETRTSSPLRIKRGENFQSINTNGLYLAGEGAGYAGGILSAAVDGIQAAEAVALDIMRSAGEK